VYVERLDWLAKNPRFTQRFAMHVGALCREMTTKAVAELERLHDKIRVLQRRAYGYRDEEYLKLKIVAAFLPPLTRRHHDDSRYGTRPT
jgi:transposase